jgi:hypothetical protein
LVGPGCLIEVKVRGADFTYCFNNIGLCGGLMPDAASESLPSAGRIAVLVMTSGSMSLLCPFFSKFDGVLLHNAADGSREFHPRDPSGARSMCDLILELKPDQMICGFIAATETQRLRGAGIDVRLGSCSCAIDELLASISTLPRA